MNIVFCPADGDPCRQKCKKICKKSGRAVGFIPWSPPEPFPSLQPVAAKLTTEQPHRFTPEEIEGFLTFLLEGGADKRCSNIYLIITQLRDALEELQRQNKILMGHSTRERYTRTLARAEQTEAALNTKPDFESWWAVEKSRPPYTNPKAIAKAAWDAVCQHHLKEC